MDMFPLAYAYDTLPPIADAGEDHNVLAGTVVALDGSGSVDDGVIIRYTWSFTFADTPVDLEGETTTFPFLLIGSYPVTLEVEDAWGNTGVSFITVDVYDDEAPVANAGDDIVIEMGTAFGFNGTASTDNGFIVTYEWNVDPEGLDRVVEGEAAMFTIDVPGDYPAVLRVYDEAGNSDIDDITIHVLDTEDPVADAGRDFAANQGEVVTLFGGWSLDNVAVFSWTWTFPEDGEVMIEVGETVDREFPFPGVYTIMLNVSDAAGNWDVDELRLTVRDIEPPVADAGMDIQVDQGTLATLDGTDSTDNVGLVGFIWLFAEGSNLKNLLGAEASYQFDIPGEYELELQAWDAAGNVGFDWVIVTVNGVGTITPWQLGPFKDDSGELGGVRVEVMLDGNPYLAYTDDDGQARFIVGIGHLVSPASVLAEKEGWKTIEFTMDLDSNGDATGSIPVMKREKGGDGDDDDDDDDIDWLAWGLVMILMIAYTGTLLYLSSAAKRAREE
ncbi:MAG: PKD domain-containing protein, partial [Candidatus Thermoplasmatota archaeon]|nr:PKD domain-containing protein [Candidatus Thermoplasmatota archaeon]